MSELLALSFPTLGLRISRVSELRREKISKQRKQPKQPTRTQDLDAIRTMNKRLGNRDQSIQGALDFLFKQDPGQQGSQFTIQS